MPKVWDCFTFFNELDVLEIRLQELADVVDRFVLVEATHTHQGEPKPLYYGDNMARFREFIDRIVHVVVEFPDERTLATRYPGLSLNWAREHYQRDMIVRGLKDSFSDDLIIISDVDEIPSADAVRRALKQNGFRVFEQRLYYYWLNCQCVSLNNLPYMWLGSVMLRIADLNTPQSVRDLVKPAIWGYGPRQGLVRTGARLWRALRGLLGKPITNISPGGWHFSYLGGVEAIISKLRAFAHAELVTDEILRPEVIQEYVKRGIDLYKRGFQFKFVPIDNSFPRCVVENPDKWRKLIYTQDPSTEAD